MALKNILYIIFSLFIISCYGNNGKDTIRILPAHSHNDYEQNRPLLDALDCHFKSIEADVYSIGDSLFVAHDFDQIKPGQTLQNLYLKPLRKRIELNNGSVFGNGEEVILFIDIKDDAVRTYQLLDKILKTYAKDLTFFENGEKKTGNIRIVVSGNRPINFMKSQKIRYASFDGRLEDLDSGISPMLMPIVSDNWIKHFSWNGTGEMPENERLKLYDLAIKANSAGYILRFWGTPNKSPEQRNSVWNELRNAGVGLIGADHLKELQQFLVGAGLR